MTDQPTPTDDDLSLALDGEADAQLLARIAASPEAQARLEQLRGAAAQVAASVVPPLGDDVIDDLIGSALETPVAPERPAPAGRRPAPWLVAAAVVLLMAVGLSLVWAGRGAEDDQASAKFESVGNSISAESGATGSDAADSSFSEAEETEKTMGSSTDRGSGTHGAPTTVMPETAAAEIPLIFLGSYDDGAQLRSATATSLADAQRLSGTTATFDSTATAPASGAGSSLDPPSAASVDRCADQLRVTLSLSAGPIQTGYAKVGDALVLVYEFAATSAVDASETTLVAAVGVDACDEVVIFER